MSVSALPELSTLTPSVGAESLLSAPGPGNAVAIHDVAASIPLIKRRQKKFKAPKDGKIYKAVLAYIALKAQGVKGPDIAAALGLAPHSLRQYVCYANKKTDWLKDNLAQPEDRVDVILSSKAVRNVETILDETVEGTTTPTERSGNFAMEVMKGVGLLKTHQVTKGDGVQNTVFALKVEVINSTGGSTNDPSSLVSLRPGSFGGAPAFDAEVIDSE